TSRLGRRRVGDVGTRAPREVLSIDAARTDATRRRNRSLARIRGRRLENPAGAMKKDPRTWVWVPPVEQEVDEELAFHLEMHTRDLIANGMAPDAARESARQRLGNLHRLRRECVSLGRKRNRIMRITQWLQDSRDDLRVAIRRLKQSPGFTLAAVATLALGIGANSAIFTLADAALLRPLRFPEADRLVMIHERTPNVDRTVVAPFEVAEWSARNRTFESMASMSFGKRAMTDADGNGAQIDAQ